MKIVAIAAVARNGVIGLQNALPWNVPEDMRFFRESTRDQIVVMGRKTYESLGKALPKRENAVVSRNPSWRVPDAQVFPELSVAIHHYRSNPELSGKTMFIIGGAEIYRQSVPFLDELWLTEIDAEFPGDTFFSGYEQGQLRIPGFRLDRVRQNQEEHPEGLRYRFSVYRKES